MASILPGCLAWSLSLSPALRAMMGVTLGRHLSGKERRGAPAAPGAEPCPQVGERASCSSSRPSDETTGPASHAPATSGGPQPQLLLHKGQGQLGCQRAGRGEQSSGSRGPTGRSSHKSCLPSTAALACQVLPKGTACPHPGELQDWSGRWATLSRLLPSALQRERTWTASACPAPHLTRVPHVSLPPL